MRRLGIDVDDSIAGIGAVFGETAIRCKIKRPLAAGAEMQGNYTAIIKQSGPWWIGWIEEVPGVNCQEPTRDELVETLKITLREALEFNRQEALADAGSDYQELQLAV